MGSPPRMRGKAFQTRPGRETHGITPAYAGKRCSRWLHRAADKDHPRICGEKSAVPLATPVRVGSPPRMRGKAGCTAADGNAEGITPAYAGKRRQQPSTSCDRQDHPRVCGEKFPNIHVPVCRSGSSPHMRGKDCGVADMVLPVRITPAYAGKSFEHTR